MKVRAGEWNYESSAEDYQHVDIDVSRVILHPQYTRSSLRNNIVLLILQKPVELAPNINTVCLPSASDITDETNCLSSGWGKDAFGKEGRYQVVMKKVKVPIVNNLQCQNELRKTPQLGPQFVLDSSSICAGGNGQDTCEGDGGSPLVCKKLDGSNKYVQLGVVAWGIGCNEPGRPAVYSSVVSAMPWITSEVTGMFGNDATKYFF